MSDDGDNYQKINSSSNGVSLALNGTSVKIVKSGKILVHPIYANIAGGKLFGILGGSGSGKTTLLNVLAGRFQRDKINVDGTITFHKDMRIIKDVNIGYVTQNDYLLPFLTVKETLFFAADLRLLPGDDIRAISRNQIVEKIILELGLKECADTIIASISGGQKRRVSVGIQMISDPKVLCLDECTSGLDSFTAITVIESLVNLASSDHQTTIICSIHQPRADIFYMFETVLLLSRGGKPTYCGKTSSIVKYFSDIGFNCPSDSNPADFFVDLVSIDPRNAETMRVDKERVSKIEESAKSTYTSNFLEISTTCQSFPVEKNDSSVTCKRAWIDQVFILTNRFYKNAFRDYRALLGNVSQSFGLGIVLMGLFWNLQSNLQDIQSRPGLVYISISQEPYILMIILIERYSNEVKILDRELQDDMYEASAFMVAHLLCMIPQLIAQALTFGIPIYFGSNMRHGIGHAIIYFTVLTLNMFVINGLSWMSISLQRPLSVATLIGNTSYTFLGLVSGFLVNFSTIPIYLKWIRFISFENYAYQILMLNEFKNRIFPSCPLDQQNTPGACDLYIGNSILGMQGVNLNDDAKAWPALVAICIGYHLFAMLMFTFVKFPPSGLAGGNDAEESEDLVESNKITTFAANEVNYTLMDTSDPPQFQDNSNSKVYEISSPQVVAIVIRRLNISAIVDSPKAAAANSILLQDDNISNDSSHNGNKPLVEPIRNESIREFDINTGIPCLSRKRYLKQLLKDISLSINPGKLTAIMGGSGSGKTTLLNVIAGRLAFSRDIENSKMNLIGSGEILFNNSTVSPYQLQAMIGYVQQADFHLPLLTVRETLEFHANLRLPQSILKEEKLHRVRNVAQLLGLTQCLDIRVGSEELKGISGGEKRRLSVGVQLLLDPSVCLLDEVTTGLDSFTARHVVETLKSITSLNRTVVLSIHQPRYDVFSLIDNVILLSRGRLVWTGTSKAMLKHFANLNFPCPDLCNPADFILDLSSIDFRSSDRELKSRDRLNLLVNAAPSMDLESPTPCSESLYATNNNILQQSAKIEHISESNPEHMKIKQVPLYLSLPLILERSYINQRRQPILITTRISQALFYALILSAFYAPVGDNQNSIQNRIGNLYGVTSLTFIGMLNCIAVFPVERDVFYREYLDGGFSETAFWITYYIFALPFLIISGALVSVLMTYAIGLQPTGEAFILFLFVSFCFMFCGECIGVSFCLLFEHVGFASNMISLIISIFCVLAGFISINIAPILSYINYISPLKYGSWIIANASLRDVQFTCDSSEELPDGQCPFSSGIQILQLYDYYEEDYANALRLRIWVLVLICGIFAIISYFVLLYRVRKLMLTTN